MQAGNSIKTLESVLDLAIWLEKHGEEFYREAMETTDDADLIELFGYLMHEEQKHCLLYTRLHEQQTGKKGGEPLHGEYAKFIELLVREVSENLHLDEVVSPRQLLWKALRFEKDTLLYYYEIKSLFSGGDVAIIDTICMEEKKHIERLMTLGKKMQLFLNS